MKRVLGIMGSPRLGGNTDLLLDQALEGARSQGTEVEKVLVDRLAISPCHEYYGCARDGNCVIRDDMDSIYPKLLEADAVLVASPIFFYGLTAQTKTLIDRSQALWARKYLLGRSPPDGGRKGAFIGIGATKGQELFTGSILTVKHFFAAIGVKYADELLVRGIDKEGQIRDRPARLKEAFEMGSRLAQT
ncbi:MAG: flavodoxin family protein [Chloroflexi bacterium]|nr:flavodoxin family protein [Chloroflexota bacterium]